MGWRPFQSEELPPDREENDVYAGVCVVGEEREREKDRFVKDPDYIMDYISVLVVSSLVLRPKAKLRTSERSKRQIPG